MINEVLLQEENPHKRLFALQTLEILLRIHITFSLIISYVLLRYACHVHENGYDILSSKVVRSRLRKYFVAYYLPDKEVGKLGENDDLNNV